MGWGGEGSRRAVDWMGYSAREPAFPPWRLIQLWMTVVVVQDLDEAHEYGM